MTANESAGRRYFLPPCRSRSSGVGCVRVWLRVVSVEYRRECWFCSCSSSGGARPAHVLRRLHLTRRQRRRLSRRQRARQPGAQLCHRARPISSCRWVRHTFKLDSLLSLPTTSCFQAAVDHPGGIGSGLVVASRHSCTDWNDHQKLETILSCR